MFIDTHAHIHSADYGLDSNEVLKEATNQGVEKIICVGTNEIDSQLAVDFAKLNQNCFATVGLHPHDSKRFNQDKLALNLEKLTTNDKVVAIGECGLDYYYDHSPRDVQKQVFRSHIELALKNNLPLVFHVRDAFDDFFAIIAEYSAIRGVVHSFSSNEATLNKAIKSNLFVAFNGIMTFSKDDNQLAAAKACPLENMLLETDSPFLTPEPKRGTINKPSNVVYVAEFLAKLRGEEVAEISKATTENAHALFGL